MCRNYMHAHKQPITKQIKNENSFIQYLKYFDILHDNGK